MDVVKDWWTISYDDFKAFDMVLSKIQSAALFLVAPMLLLFGCSDSVAPLGDQSDSPRAPGFTVTGRVSYPGYDSVMVRVGQDTAIEVELSAPDGAQFSVDQMDGTGNMLVAGILFPGDTKIAIAHRIDDRPLMRIRVFPPAGVYDSRYDLSARTRSR